MKKLLLFLTLLVSGTLFCQLTEGFESGLPASYSSPTSYTLSSGTWLGQANGVIAGTVGFKTGTKSCQLRSQVGSQVTTPTITSTVGSITFWASRSTGSGTSLQVRYSTDNGVTWTQIGTTFSLTTTVTQFTAILNSSSTNIKIQFYRTSSTVYIDDVSISQNNNTNCSTVTSLSVPVTVGGTTTTGTQSTCGKTNDYPANSFGSVNYGNGEDAVWSITVPSGGGNYQFNLGGTATWKILSLHSSCIPSNSNVLNYSTTSSGSSTMFTQQLSAGTYYLWVDTWPNPTCGDYSILITKLSNPPVNDEVSGAIDLVVNDPFISGTNVGSTSSTTAPTPTGPQYFGQDVWYKVTVPSNGIVQIDTDLGGLTDMVMEVYSGTISSLTYITFNDDSLSTVELMPYIELTGRAPGETIYIRLWDYFGDQTGTFSIKALTPTSLPVELLYFEGKSLSTTNYLYWSTASEHNSDYFQIERSIDGEKWESVGSKTASGNSNSKIDYNFLDSFDDLVINYYILKQFDFDGQFKIYGPISLDNTMSFKKIVKYVNLFGQEVNSDTKGFIFEVYEDGTNRRIVR